MASQLQMAAIIEAGSINRSQISRPYGNKTLTFYVTPICQIIAGWPLKI